MIKLEKLDYYAEHTFSDPTLPYHVHWWYTPTTDYHRHMDFYELFMTIEDGMIQYYNGKLMTLEPHALYIIPPMQYHRIDCVKEDGRSNLFNVGVKKSFFERSIETFSAPLAEAAQKSDCLFIAPEAVSYEFLMLLAKRATYSEDANRRLQAVRLFLATAATLYQSHVSDAASLSPQQRFAADVKRKIDDLEYIEDDIASIYARYPIAPAQLIKEFKDLTGKTIIRYQVERRMKYACNLLTNTDYTILRISSTIGYDSLSHFTDNFKKFTGLTPMAYRRENVRRTQNTL